MSALVIAPSFRGRSAGIDARWLATARFAGSLGRVFDGLDVLTPYGLFRPEEIETWAVQAESQRSVGRGAAQRLPRPARVFLGDVREATRARRMRRVAGTLEGEPYRLVVQFHRRFQDCGARLAGRIGVPFVLRIEALEVREEADWGVRRPGWGWIAERLAEHRVIRQAALVATVSEALDAQLADAGIPQDRRVVIPNGVDLEVFCPGDPVVELREANGLRDRFVVGWIGGFQPFHGLELLPDVALGLRERIPKATVCLLGTGPLRPRVAEQLQPFGETVRFIGPVQPSQVPGWIRSFDVCLLLGTNGSFHYSPLKLFEYLACARPVVAAAVGQVASVLEDGRDSLLVPPGDPNAVVRAIERLASDVALRARLGTEGRRTAELRGSWDVRTKALVEALEDRGLLTDVSRSTA